MKSIWKYPLEVQTHQLVYMPKGAKIVYVGEQNEYPVLYAEVDVDAEPEPCIFTIITTGERFETMTAQYVGMTVLKGWYVAHIFRCALPVEGRKTPDMEELQAELREES